MTDETATETTETVDTLPEVEAPPAGDDIPDAEVTDENTGLSRRDIRYREQLRAAEAERDTLRQNIENMQRREVERLAADHITKPGALWTAGTELADLLGDDGAVDPDKVAAATADARKELGLEHPQAQRARGPVISGEGRTYRGRGDGGRSGSWAAAFR